MCDMAYRAFFLLVDFFVYLLLFRSFLCVFILVLKLVGKTKDRQTIIFVVNLQDESISGTIFMRNTRLIHTINGSDFNLYTQITTIPFYYFNQCTAFNELAAVYVRKTKMK